MAVGISRYLLYKENDKAMHVITDLCADLAKVNETLKDVSGSRFPISRPPAPDQSIRHANKKMPSCLVFLWLL